MKRFAIDVVILPPDPVMDLVLGWNHVLCKAHPKNIVLDRTHYLPHISMTMGCLAGDQLEHANTILQSFATQHHALELYVPHIKIVPTASGDRVITLDIDLSRELAGLHESIVTAFSPLLTQDTTEADMFDLPPIELSSLDWINRYIPHYSFDHFWPHITLGFGGPPGNFAPFSFKASRLAICHLGNHCTCRTILKEVSLTPR